MTPPRPRGGGDATPPSRRPRGGGGDGPHSIAAAQEATARAAQKGRPVDGDPPIDTYYVLAGNTPVLVHNTGGCWRDSFDNLPTGKQSHVRTVGSEDELRDLFGRMTNGAEQLPARGPKIPEVYRQADGTVIQWRGASRSGGTTIDIFPPNSKGLKVHVEEP